MKYKKMWFTLIPTILLMLITKVYQIYAEQTGNSIFGNDNIIASYVTIGLVFVQFIILFIMSVTDKKTASVYNYKKNTFAGSMCLFSAVALIVDVCCYLPSILIYKNYTSTTLLNIILSCVAAFGLFLLSWTHISGKKPPSTVSLLMLTVPLWCVVKLFTALTENSASSVVMTDVLDLFIYLFLSLYLLSATSIISMLNQKNYVKEIVLFGIPLVSVLVTYDVQIVTKLILNGYTSGYYMEIIKACELTLFALYAVAFMLEISKYSKNKDEVRISKRPVPVKFDTIYSEILELNEEIRNQKLKSFEKLQAKERKNGNLYITHDSSFQSIDTKDSGYFPTGATYGKYVEDYPVVSGSDENDKGFTTEEKISNVDRLILEITSGKNDKDLSPEDEEN